MMLWSAWHPQTTIGKIVVIWTITFFERYRICETSAFDKKTLYVQGFVDDIAQLNLKYPNWKKSSKKKLYRIVATSVSGYQGVS